MHREDGKALIWHEGKDKTQKNVDVLNLTRNFRLCSHHFDNKKIITDSYTSGDPVCFAWSNYGNTLAWEDRKGFVLQSPE